MPNPRKPQSEKELIGTARKDRLEPDSIQLPPVEVLPESPSFLTKTGRKHWKKYTKLLQNEAILAETDLDSLGLYCMHLQIAEEAAEELRKGVVREMKDDNGKVYYVETPNLLKIFNEASSAAMKYGQQFGFTPVSRKNVPAPKVKKGESLLDKLRKKRADGDLANPFKVAS